MNEVISLHRAEYSAEPEKVVSAPGVVTLMGEYTEQSEGFVLPVGINRSMTVAVSRRKDNSLRFYAADLNERKRTSLSNLKYKREDRWANYLKGVIHGLIELGCPIKGLNMTVAGNVPPGIGLASSAAITVATALAVKELFSFECTDQKIVECARAAETDFIGTSTGVVHPFVALNARKGYALFLDTRSLDFRPVSLDMGDVRLLITDSKVPQNVSEAELAQRSADCEECVTILAARKSGTTLRDYSPRDLRDSMGTIPEGIRRRCLHVVEENQRVHESEIALRQRNYAALGKLMNRSHESLRDLFEVSCPELDWLVKRSWEIDGVYGSRMTGIGFGGCTVTLLRADAVDKYLKRLEEYERIFGFKAEAFVCEPSDGAGKS
jgi:galactokinase